MSLLTLPQGQSVREIAERLGVSVDALMQHAGVHDPEAPLAVAKSIEVPDGFLRSRVKKEQLQDAITATSGKKAGMNMWLAMDIEQKRTRAAGGMHAKSAGDNELSGLEEARRTYLRFDCTSNDLAIALYGNLASTHSTPVRAQAFAGQALAYAQRVLLFQQGGRTAKAQALSAAKAAQLADPKLSDGHLAMALALSIDATPEELDEAEAELHTAARCDKRSPWPNAALAQLALKRGDKAAAHDHVRAALQLDATCVLALEVAARLAEDVQDWQGALKLWELACETTPTYKWAQVGVARTLRHLGREQEATRKLDALLADEQSPEFRAVLLPQG